MLVDAHKFCHVLQWNLAKLTLPVFIKSQLMVHFSCSKPLVDGEGKHKDTLNNIKATKEFVVNMISEPFVEASKCVTSFGCSVSTVINTNAIVFAASPQ